MAFLKLLLRCGLFIAMIIFSTGEDGQFGINISENYQLPDYIVPVHYVIAIHFAENDLNFNGELNVSIHINRTTQYIGLHLLKYKIHITETELIRIHKENDTIKEHKYNCNSFIYNYNTNINVLYLKDKVSQGYYFLIIKYVITVRDNEGFFTTSYVNEQGKKEWLLATHFQPIGARWIFPCWDEPRFKTTFEMYLLHHPKYTILSNNLSSQQQLNTDDEALRWTDISSSSALPTHLMALAIINFPRQFSNDMISMYCRDDVKFDVTFAWNVAKKVTDYLKNEWKLLIKVNHVLIPNFLDNGVSNWQLIFYRETAVVCDEDFDVIGYKLKVADLVARLTVKQWFGNIIIPLSWSQMWFTKSLATFFAIDAIDKTKIFENDRVKYVFIEQIQYESLHLDYLHYNNFDEDSIAFNVLAGEIESPSDIKSHFSLPYYRGVCILRMLQHIVTDKIFRDGINTYLRTNTQVSVTSNNFWHNLYTVINSTYNRSDLDIKNIMNGWVRLWHCPVLIVKQNDERNGVLVYAKPSGFTLNQLDSPNLWIPVTFTTESELNFAKTSFQNIIWLKNKPVEIYVRETDWIIVNLQQTGYYRVNYDDDIWLDIINYLHTRYYIYIHFLNRAKLIDDAFHFMITQQLSPSIFWKLTDYLHQEINYITWYPMFKAMEYMSKIFPYSDLENNAVKQRLVSILDSLIGNITINKNLKKDNLTLQCLWREAYKWICILNNQKCREHMEEFDKHKFLANYIYHDQWLYFCVQFKLDRNNNLLTNLLQGYKMHNEKKILESLVCSENFKLIRKFLIRTRDNGEIQLDKHTRIKIFFSILARHAKNNEILDLIFYNFELATPGGVSEVALLIHIINNVYSQEGFNKVTKYVENNIKLTQLRLIIEQKINSRLRNIEKHKNYVRTISPFNKV